MRLGILQPYCFPYLGYFQLINLADRVILLDTVQFTRPNWINRNWLADARGRVPFVFPVQKSSIETPIHAVRLSAPERCQAQFLKTLQTVYGRAPYYELGRAAVTRAFEGADGTLADLSARCVVAISQALGITTPLHRAHGRYTTQPKGAEQLVLHLCREERADIYVNPEGGQHLYSANSFRSAGIGLEFLQHISTSYDRGGRPFFPRLSVLDALMYCSQAELSALLGNYRILNSV